MPQCDFDDYVPRNASYRAICAAYERLAADRGWRNQDGRYFPISLVHLEAYVSYQLPRIADGTIKASTLRKYLSALKDVHSAVNANFPPIPVSVRRAISLATSTAPPTTLSQKPEVTVHLLRMLRRKLRLTEHDELVLWTIAITAFWGLARRRKLLNDDPPSSPTTLYRKHVSFFDTPVGRAFQIRIPKPKVHTDHPQYILVRPLPAQPSLCPATALTILLDRIPTDLSTPLWTLRNGNTATTAWFVRLFNGLSHSDTGASSFRAGGATQLAFAGVSD
ncbi:hypothetical protein HDU86_001491 [Geranomyces michiganensis]|nr:hypothetical protein HDU86_001491 [Geranomyces michiganensis]